jgi:hypothetical protein
VVPVPREISGLETDATFRRSERRVVRSRVPRVQKCTGSVAETEHVRTRLDRKLEYSVISPRPFRVPVASRARRRTLFQRAAGAFSPEPGNQGLIRQGRNRGADGGSALLRPNYRRSRARGGRDQKQPRASRTPRRRSSLALDPPSSRRIAEEPSNPRFP